MLCKLREYKELSLCRIGLLSGMSPISILMFYVHPKVLALLNSQTLYLSTDFYLWSHVEQETNIWLNIYHGPGTELDTFIHLHEHLWMDIMVYCLIDKEPKSQRSTSSAFS